jgi:transaldolase
MNRLTTLKVKIFADGADKAGILEMYRNPLIKGFTTNPTLMRKSGVVDYQEFALSIVEGYDRPISFEVFSDDFNEMERQARKIASWAGNIYVKIPVTNTRGSRPLLIRSLAQAGIKLNDGDVDAGSGLRCECCLAGALLPVCRFATHSRHRRDLVPSAAAVELVGMYPNVELIWASPRELLNIFQADAIGCHIITATNDILRKLALVGKDLREYSLDTVKMFHADATAAGFSL